MDPKKINLNAPAFGADSQTIKDVEADDNTSEEVQSEEKEVEKEEVQQESSEEDESKVPYSRFKKFHDEAKELRQRVAELEALKGNDDESKSADKVEDDMPASWVKLYGDSDASKEAWQIQKDLNAELVRKAREEAVETIRSEKSREIERVNENVQVIDEGFEDLSALVGRDLTEKEQSAILDIVDDYTPKDEEGNYAGAILSFEKAWEIYELKNEAKQSSKRQSRNSVASLTGSQTQGETSIKGEKDNNFNPLDWNAYKQRL